MQLRYERLSVALFALIAALALVSSVTRADDAATETIELQPGNNFVGWVAEPIATEDIFKDIPEATLIYTWNADSRSYQYAIRDVGGSLETLDSGMAAMIRIDGRRTVKWERSLTPAKGGITLYAGVNWVAWNGRDDWPLDQVARGIGTSLISIEVEERGIVYQPGSDISEAIAPLRGESSLRRGDALRVTVNRDLRWLQPTAMMPQIEWVGDPSESLKKEITADIRRVLDFFAKEFAVETDFSDTTVLVWHDVESAVEHEAAGRQPDFNISSPEQLRVKLEHDAGGWADDWGLVVAACWWDPPCPLPRSENERGRDLTAHEWFHYLQLQLAARHWWTVSPEWMLEGTAIWGGDRGLGVADGVATLAHDHQWRQREASRTSATLRSAEERNAPWQYHLGLLAVDLLVEGSDANAPIEYFRNMHPQVVNGERQWVKNPNWREAFRLAFGIDADAFYEDFAAWRSELPEAAGVAPVEPRLQGSLHHADGTPATGFWINAATYEGEHKAGRIRRNNVRADGTFAIDLEANTVQRIWITRDTCQLWLTDVGPTVAQPELGLHRDLNTTNLPRLDLVLPEGACTNEFRATVLALHDDNRTLQVELLNVERRTHQWVGRDRNESYLTFAKLAGPHLVRVRVGTCLLYYGQQGLVARQGDADSVELGDTAVSVNLRVPEHLCVRQIEGHLVGEEGTILRDWQIAAHAGPFGPGMGGVATSETDGHFRITVPTNGAYKLWVSPGCLVAYRPEGATTEWEQATPITVADEDVTGIEFVVPDDPASLCR